MPIKPELLAELQALLASYWGNFSHADAYHLKQGLLQAFPWVNVLLGINPKGNWYSRTQPGVGYLDGYRRQIEFFRAQYPTATLHIQRGTQVDIFPGEPSYYRDQGSFSQFTAAVSRVEVRKHGQLNNGLKKLF